MHYKNPNIANLVRVFDQNDRSAYLRLDLNENPGGLPDEFVKDVLADVTPQLVAQYPETRRFSEFLANYLGTDASRLCLVNGSAEGIRHIIEGFTSPGGRVVGVAPSYFMLFVYAEMYGRDFVKVPYGEDLSMDVDRIIEQMTEDTQLLILLNPNNPMGNVYSEREFKMIMEEAEKKKITVLVDEAYFGFCDHSFMRHALAKRNLFVTRTFSKLFSMAGCRLGYVVGWPEGVEIVQKLCTPHNTNAFALKIAQAVLETPGLVDDLIRKFAEGREYLTSWLDENGYQRKGDAGNFIFIKPRSDAERIVARMKEEKKILIKAYPNVGKLGTCLRVSIGERKYMERFTSALRDLDDSAEGCGT